MTASISLTPEVSKQHTFDTLDREFQKSLFELAEQWYKIICAQGACTNQNAARLFASEWHSDKVIYDYCRICPVRVECLSYAVATHQTGTVWGGFDEKYRQGIEEYAASQLRILHGLDIGMAFSYNASFWDFVMNVFDETASNPHKVFTTKGIPIRKKNKDKNYLVN